MRKSAGWTAAAERSRWLAELAEAVAQAQRLARALDAPEGNCPPARRVYGRLESIRIEIESLRRGSWGARPIEIDPQWMSFFPLDKGQKN